MKKRLLLAALALCAGLAWAEIELTDTKGRTVKLNAVPERVALGFYYEDYLAVTGKEGLDKVVALSRYTWKDWRSNQYALYEQALPRLKDIPDMGSTANDSFSVEKLIAAEPDVLIVAAWDFDALGEAAHTIEAAGIPIVVLDYNAQTIEKHVRSTLVLGKLMGQESRAQALVDNYQAAMEAVMARVEKAQSQPKVYVELAQNGAEQYGNSYGNTMWGALITQLGGENIAAKEISNSGPLNPEYILAQEPDVIFLAGSKWKNKPQSVTVGFGAQADALKTRMQAYMQRPGWTDLPAVKNRRVHAIYHGGARTLSDYVYAQYIAKQLYPDLFEDIDPEQNLRDYYAKWLPIAADGIFMWQYQP